MLQWLPPNFHSQGIHANGGNAEAILIYQDISAEDSDGKADLCKY